MSGDVVDLAALAADESLIVRIRGATAPGQLGTESERVLLELRVACRTTMSQLRCPSCGFRGSARPEFRGNRAICAARVTVTQGDLRARELSAWGNDLHEQGQRLAKRVAVLLGRLAETEERIAEVFARRAVIAPDRADEPWHFARQARAQAQRLRSQRARLR